MIFDNTPFIGQQVVYQGRAWYWNGTGWQVQPNIGQVSGVAVPLVNYVDNAQVMPLSLVLYSNDPEGAPVITYV